MELKVLNDILSRLEEDRENGREHILALAAALIDWMGFRYAENSKPRLLDFQTIRLKEALAPAPVTGQEQLYRLTAEGQQIRVRFAVLKKYEKKTVQYLVDNNVGLTSYQASMRGIKQVEGREPFIAQQSYFLHFITTARYDRLWVVFNEGEQKRVLIFRRRLSQTQFNKILPAWQNIAAKSKPEMAKLFWSSLDVKEVNKEFYKQIKTQFDAMVGIASTQLKNADENAVKQFAVRLIGRYIFCWFLKEKEVIPGKLLSSNTIEKYKEDYFQKYLVKLFFNTLNTEVTDPTRNEIKTGLDELYKNIPYLNGGLFDRHPEDDLFEKLDLNGWLIVFVKILESFDFTVDESSSQYQLVSIDPEMLGRIFENLLASQNPETEKMANQRKAFGAFYTPREIVDYMVNESLKAYVETQLVPEPTEEKNLVNEPVVAYKGSLFQALEPQQTLMALDKGEPSAVDRQRVQLKGKIEKLFSPDCAENPFTKEETNRLRKAFGEITVLDPACGSGAFPMGMMLRLMELRQIIGHGHRNNYDLKEEILSKNIFGVDIMPMAVEIARLRAWLSLVLEADYKPADRKNNFGIAALPNLDFKFVCANSLIDSGYDQFLSNLNKTTRQGKAALLDDKIHRLEQIRDEYFDPKGDKNWKEELQKEFRKTKNFIKTEFESLKKTWKLEDFLSKVDDWDPFDDSHPSSFFSPAWMFGVKNGFDVVIGNPPYVNISNLKPDNFREILKERFYSAKNKTDLYAFFIEAFSNKLVQNGNLVLIIPHTWKATDSFSRLREFIFKNTQVHSIVNLEMGVFEAVVQPMILHLVKCQTTPYSIRILNKDFILIDSLPVQEVLQDRTMSVDTTSSMNQKMLFNKIENNSFFLEEAIQFSRGIKTSDDDRFIGSKKVNEEYKPVYRGKNIKAYQLNWNNEFIWYRPDLMKEKVGSVAYSKEFFEVSEKIVTQRVNSSGKLLVAYDDKQNYFLDTANVSRSDSWDKKTPLKYICGVLNSMLINFWYCNKYRMPTIGLYELHCIPIKLGSTYLQKLIIGKVEKILVAKSKQIDTSELQKEIDVLVYKLYDLTYDEVKIIDKDFWMSDEEYGNVKIVK